MILRILNFIFIGVLILAAAYVYRIKFTSTVQAEHLAKLRSEIRHERDDIAALRAQWGELDDPARIEALTKRYLKLKPVVPTQFDSLDHLPDRPAEDAFNGQADPIGGFIQNLEAPETITGSIPAAGSIMPDNATPAAGQDNDASMPSGGSHP